MNLKCGIIKRLEILLVFFTMSFVLLTNSVQTAIATSNSPFSLIDYVSTHEISSLSDFNEVLEHYCNRYYEPFFVENEVFFQLDIDTTNNLVIISVIEDLPCNRDTKTARGTKKYYSDDGAVAFTVSVEGRFGYSYTQSTALSVTGSFSPAPLSLWTSTPTLTSGNFSPTLAYVKIYGTATCLLNTQFYSITLMCDNYGNITGN
ncbi:MAG: hypothetical protein IKG93_01140 [Clostridiales bacterium]|nr:hypothetical protein [Clostridiales bacterium]